MRETKISRVAAGLLAAAPIVAFPNVSANEGSSNRFLFDVVRRGAVASSIDATGTVQAVETVEIGSEVSGLIAKVLVTFNDAVAAGQPLAELDRNGYQARVAEARASVKVAQALASLQRAALSRADIGIATARAEQKTAEAHAKAAEIRRDEAQREHQRKLTLARTGAASERDVSGTRATLEISEADLRAAVNEIETKAAAIGMAQTNAEMARANVVTADATVEEKQAALDEALVALERTIIRAPINGVVIGREVNPGQTVAAGLETKTLFTIAHDLGEMQVKGAIDEADIGQVREGQRAEFTVDAYPGRVFEGRVAQVRKAPATQQNVVTYAAIVSAANPGRRLFPGMTVSLKIVTEEAVDVLTVPNRALHFEPGAAVVPVAAEPFANHRTIWTRGAEGRAISVPIEIGASDESRTEVVAGDLREGEPVIVGFAKTGRQP